MACSQQLSGSHRRQDYLSAEHSHRHLRLLASGQGGRDTQEVDALGHPLHRHLRPNGIYPRVG